MELTIQAVRESLNDSETIFMAQGKGSKVVHISAGDCKSNNLLHGATYARGGSRRPSIIFPIRKDVVDTDSLCKKCAAALDYRIAWNANH